MAVSRLLVSAGPALQDTDTKFITEFGRSTGGDPLVRTVQLVHSWRRFPRTDPALPAQLLPRQWSGVRAAKIFSQRRGEARRRPGRMGPAHPGRH
jgi:DNA-binding transcriptional regulator PaaX